MKTNLILHNQCLLDWFYFQFSCKKMSKKQLKKKIENVNHITISINNVI